MFKRQITPGYWYIKYDSWGMCGWTIVRVEVSLDTQNGLEKNGFEAYYVGEELPLPLDEGWDDALIGPVMDPAHFYL